MRSLSLFFTALLLANAAALSPARAQSPVYRCGTQDIDLSLALTGTYKAKASPTLVSSAYGPRAGGGGEAIEVVIRWDDSIKSLVLQGWPKPADTTPLISASQHPYDANEWTWDAGRNGTVSSTDLETLADCPISELPRYYATATTRGREKGIPAVHTLRLVDVSVNAGTKSLIGYWKFEADVMTGSLTVYLTQTQ
jgi:hypothetical protein